MTDETTTWLAELYGDDAEGWISLFSLDRQAGRSHVDWAPANDAAEIARLARHRATRCCVWFGVATRHHRLDGGQRGGRDDCTTIPGLWLDVDVVGPGHRSTNRLAPDLDAAHALVARFPEPPTAIIHSGGGLQAWWLFAEPMTADDDAQHLLDRWGATWARLGDEAGIDPDPVFDLPRIMRLPGTTNRKDGLERPVTVDQVDYACRYNPTDLADHLDDVPAWEPPARATDGWQDVRPDAADAPGALWAAHADWDTDLLGPDGWHRKGPSGGGGIGYVRPGNDPRGHIGATLDYAGTDLLKVMTPSLAHMGLEQGKTYSKFGYYAATRHGGDHAAAARHLRAQGWKADPAAPSSTASGPQGTPGADEDVEPGDWEPVDLSGVVSGRAEPPQPTILTPFGGTPLLYEGRTNMIFGESGAGKTWVELAAIAEILHAGDTAGLIDLEDTDHGIVSRLRLLGVPDDAIVERFLYWSPSTGFDERAAAAMTRVITERRPRLVCIDSTGEAMAAAGVKGNDDDDVARWFVRFPKMIARLGPAVVIVDHVPKDPNAPIGYAIGSQRKVAAIDGAAYRVDAVKVPSKVDDGLLKITTAKDRHGNHTKGRRAAEVAITHTAGGGVSLDLNLPEAAPTDEAGNFRPTVLMERSSRTLEEAGDWRSANFVRKNTKGKDSGIDIALGALVAEGFVEGQAGPRGTEYRSVRPFREDADGRSGYTESAPPNDIGLHRPTSAFHNGAEVPDGLRPPAPPLKGPGRSPGPAGDPVFDPTSAQAEGPRFQAVVDPFDLLDEEDF